MSRARKVLIALIILFLLMTAAVYGYGVYYFSTHFLPGSRVNHTNCSYMSMEEAQKTLAAKTASYTLTVRSIDKEDETITASDISLQYVEDGSISKILHEQNRFLWFTAFTQSKEYKVTVSYDQELYDQKLASLSCLNGTRASSDAYLLLTDTGDSYEIVPEVEGNIADPEKTRALIEDAVTSGITVLDLDAEGCYDKPSVYRDNAQLVSDCEELNRLSDVIITYDFGDRKETVDAEVIRGFMSRGEDDRLFLDKELIGAYVKNLAETYDTVGSERTFSTFDNREVTVSGGDYGWVIDQEKETDALYQAITDQKTQVREPVYSQEASSRETNDIGYSYVEIDLSNYRLVLYIEGNPVVDSIVSSIGGLSTGVYYEKELSDTGSDVWNGTDPAIASENAVISENTSEEFGDGSVFEESTGNVSGDFSIPSDVSYTFSQYADAELPLVIYR